LFQSQFIVRQNTDWQFLNAENGNTLDSDLNRDGIVNFIDFASLAADWLITKDIYDLDIMADDWLKITNIDPNIQIQIIGDPNTGYIDIGFSGWTIDTRRIFLLADGQVVGGTFRFKDDETITIDISKYGNGEK
jgi:hypothetical protein